MINVGPISTYLATWNLLVQACGSPKKSVVNSSRNLRGLKR